MFRTPCNACPFLGDTATIQASWSQEFSPGLRPSARKSGGNRYRWIVHVVPCNYAIDPHSMQCMKGQSVQNNKSTRSNNPPIHLIDVEYDVIADLAIGIERNRPSFRRCFSRNRPAEIHNAHDIARAVLPWLRSDAAKGLHTRHLRLVLPIDADIEEGRVSILTPMGAGLIGLRTGQSINWPYPDGSSRVLKILKVTHPKRD